MRKHLVNTGLLALTAAMSLSGSAAFAKDMSQTQEKPAYTVNMEEELQADTESIYDTEDTEHSEDAGENSPHSLDKDAPDTVAASAGEPESDSLSESMQELASKIEDLTAETKNLRDQIEDIQEMNEAETEVIETEADQVEETEVIIPEVYMDGDKFLRKIRKSFKKRTKAAITYSESELGTMTNDELVEANAACCEAERDFYEKYQYAVFDNKDIQYLCGQYIAGLKNQFDAYDVWKENKDINLYNELWDAGYTKRACTICELAEQYEIDFGDISEMQKKVEELEKKNGETPKTDLGTESVLECQNHLNTLGFRNTADGSWGARTSKMLKRFQLMYGYGPVDGVLTENILRKLRQEAEKVAPPETETETEAETEASAS